MKLLRDIITGAFCTFTVLSVLFGVLCEADVLVNLPYTQVVFTLLLMSAGTSAFVALRELLLPQAEKLKYAIELPGCTFIILMTVHFAGWLELRAAYFLLVFAMVLVVYLSVWFLTWLQSKHDEDYLNALLSRREKPDPDSEK